MKTKYEYDKELRESNYPVSGKKKRVYSSTNSIPRKIERSQYKPKKTTKKYNNLEKSK